MRARTFLRLLGVTGMAAVCGWQGQGEAGAADPPDARAASVARAVLERLGGAEAWEKTRHVRWKFFGRRLHFWDKWTGDIRIESPAREDRPARLVLMNIHDKQGRVWENGEEITDAGKLDEALLLGHQWWVNDSYWMFMPYKLLDPGVILKYAGERPLADGRPAEVLELTFDAGIGYTPENRYEIFVAKDTGHVEQWSFYAKAGDAEPQFTDPWKDWKKFGGIWLATGHGQDGDWDIAVYDSLPASVYKDPAPAGG